MRPKAPGSAAWAIYRERCGAAGTSIGPVRRTIETRESTTAGVVENPITDVLWQATDGRVEAHCHQIEGAAGRLDRSIDRSIDRKRARCVLAGDVPRKREPKANSAGLSSCPQQRERRSRPSPKTTSFPSLLFLPHPSKPLNFGGPRTRVPPLGLRARSIEPPVHRNVGTLALRSTARIILAWLGYE